MLPSPSLTDTSLLEMAVIRFRTTSGGRGGDVTVQGNAISFVDDDRPELLGGAGGNSARGGNVSVLSEWPVNSDVLSSILVLLAKERREDAAKHRSVGSAPSPRTACSETTVNPGGHGADVQGGTGGEGNPGLAGTPTNPNGQTGFPGIAGGAGTPGSGVVGDTGTDCCDQSSPTGGKGGTGGRAGQGVGGTGGMGGRGGNAYRDPGPGSISDSEVLAGQAGPPGRAPLERLEPVDPVVRRAAREETGGRLRVLQRVPAARVERAVVASKPVRPDRRDPRGRLLSVARARRAPREVFVPFLRE